MDYEKRLSIVEDNLNALIMTINRIKQYIDADINANRINTGENATGVSDNDAAICDIADLVDTNSAAIDDLAVIVDELSNRVSDLEG